MNRAELRNRILEGLNESTSSPSFWSAAEINSLIDEAGEFLAEEASAIKRTALIPFRAGAIYYYTQSVAPDVLMIYRIWHATNNERLEPVTISDLDRHHETWARVTSSYPDYWFPVSWNLFGVWPGTAAAGGVMRVDYLAWPRSLLSDSDTPEISEADQDTLVLYGIYDGLLKQWDVPRALAIFAEILDRLPKKRRRQALEMGAARLEKDDADRRS